MKKYFIFAASALAIASCQNDEFLGEVPGNVKEGASSAINIGGEIGKVTRASHVGADAARLLNKQFIVAGYKGEKSTDGIATTPVFDHYVVKWKANTAGTTDDNTSDWKYVGETPEAGLTGLSNTQTIKYWDNTVDQYDFVAFSKGTATMITSGTIENDEKDETVRVTKVTPETAAKAPTQSESNVTGGAYTVTGNATALSKFYIADLITMYKGADKSSTDYGKEVVPHFRNLTCKARVAFYETVPGYSVKEVQFYHDGSTDLGDLSLNTSATLYTTGSESTDCFYTEGTLGIYFPTVGSSKKSESDYNKAHVIVFPTSSQKTLSFGTVSENSTLLKTTSQSPSFAGQNSEPTANYYQTVLPNETGTTLTLRVNYTLVADDGSGETIKVYGAKAIVPAIYAQWKSNYAYTYIFKISDNTNGWTSTDNNRDPGLFPITFDAVVVDAEEHEQSTITTVATPSITTYQKGHKYNANNEYVASNGVVYVRVQDENGFKNDLNTENKAFLYTIEDPNSVGITEANIHDALTIGSLITGDETTGRNGIQLTKEELKTDVIDIPGVDGNYITVVAGTAASFTPSAGTTYAFVYQLTPGTNTTINTAYVATGNEIVTADTYYTDFKCTEAVPAGTNLTSGITYYQKVTVNNSTYAIKVIKVQ